MNVEDLSAIGGIQRPGSDREVRLGIHVVPPEQLRAGETWNLTAQGLPELFSSNDMIALFPEPDLGGFSIIPAIGDGAVLARGFTGNKRRLSRAGDRRKSGAECLQPVLLRKPGKSRHVLAKKRPGESDDIKNSKTHDEYGG